MQVDKAIELFQIVVIVSLNMGNFNLEVSSLKIDWPQRRRRRQYYVWNWIREVLLGI